MAMKFFIITVIMGVAGFSSVRAQDSIVKAKILDDGSQNAEKFYNSGIHYFQEKNYKAALLEFDQAITLKVDFDKAYYNRGNTKFELADYKGSMED